MTGLNIIGLSAFYHESSCCLLQDGKLVAAVSEERFSRIKHDARLPVSAFRYCLDAGSLTIVDVDAVAYYEQPEQRLARQLWCGPPAAEDGDLAWLDPHRPKRSIRERLGFEGPIITVDHHDAHAASAFFFSGFDEAALLTVDGVGEWETTTYGLGRGHQLDRLDAVLFPHSLGLLYATLTSYLGFRVNRDEYKVMGLAAFGAPRYLDQVFQLIGMGPDGQFMLNRRYFDFVRGSRMYSDALIELFGRPPRLPNAPIETFHHDVARSVQLALEEILLEKVGWLHDQTGSSCLCMAGGVALNGVANGRIRREGAFEDVFVQPAAGDAGGALGAAALAHVTLAGSRPSQGRLRGAGLGPRFEPDGVARMIAASGLEHGDFRGRTPALIETVVERLADNQIIGWFHGAMEFGPRALGARSILANPLDPDAQQRLNERIKRRESFRPFAPSVLSSHAADHFDLDHPSAFMLETCLVRSPLVLPAITHVDGSARPQTVAPEDAPRFAALIEAFGDRTGCPMLLNTSFNGPDEPIVCDPVDALLAFATLGLDVLVLEDFVIERPALPLALPALAPIWSRPGIPSIGRESGPLREFLYSFV